MRIAHAAGILGMTWDAASPPSICALPPARTVEKDIPLMIRTLMNVFEWYVDNDTLGSICRVVLDRFGSQDAAGRYDITMRRLGEAFPNLDILFEKMFVNHLFFMRFPFDGRSGDRARAPIALCGTYLFLLLVALANVDATKGLDDFIAVMARTFRVLAHADFGHNLIVLLGSSGVRNSEDALRLLPI
jgi:hypothetical protein